MRTQLTPITPTSNAQLRACGRVIRHPLANVRMYFDAARLWYRNPVMRDGRRLREHVRAAH